MHANGDGVHYTDDGHLLVKSQKHKSELGDAVGTIGLEGDQAGSDQVDQGFSQRPVLSIVLLSGESFMKPGVSNNNNNNVKTSDKNISNSSSAYSSCPTFTQSSTSLHTASHSTISSPAPVCKNLENSHRKSRPMIQKFLSKSEIDLSEAELPEKDLKILELLVKRRQKSFQDEEESFQKQKQWLREKEVEEAHKVAFEKEHRELIAKKRDKEREDFYRRLEEAQQKLIIAQNNLEKVLQKHQQEKKVTFKESSPSKDKTAEVTAIAKKSKNVQKALEEMQKREEQLQRLHDKHHQGRESDALKRKEEMENKIRDKILSANREEKIKHKKRMRKLENLYRHNLRRMRKTLEVKLEKSATVLEEQREERKRKITENSFVMQAKKDQAQNLKKELEDGLEKWRHQVMEVQENNIRRAELQAEGTKTLRRQRSREERRSRERRVMERRKQSKEREEEQIKAKQDAIEEKQRRVDNMLREREESVERQRRLAAKTARLRRSLRSQSCSNYISRKKMEAVI